MIQQNQSTNSQSIAHSDLKNWKTLTVLTLTVWYSTNLHWTLRTPEGITCKYLSHKYQGNPLCVGLVESPHVCIVRCAECVHESLTVKKLRSLTFFNTVLDDVKAVDFWTGSSGFWLDHLISSPGLTPLVFQPGSPVW